MLYDLSQLQCSIIPNSVIHWQSSCIFSDFEAVYKFHLVFKIYKVKTYRVRVNYECSPAWQW